MNGFLPNFFVPLVSRVAKVLCREYDDKNKDVPIFETLLKHRAHRAHRRPSKKALKHADRGTCIYKSMKRDRLIYKTLYPQMRIVSFLVVFPQSHMEAVRFIASGKMDCRTMVEV